MSLSAGTRLGAYEILQPLGAGGMGEVYRAWDPKLGRHVAIKVLAPHLASDRAALARFEREARAVAALSHPNILGIFDLGTENGTVFAVMELLEGETLRFRLGASLPAPATGGAPVAPEALNRLPIRKAIEYALQVAQGLAAAHDKGIVHRDLKPENVFITKDGRVKILDFGLAQVRPPASPETDATVLRSGAQTQPGTILGTVGYMSPEQVRGEATDHRSDIFSFGVLLYEMLAGRPAFHYESAVETMTAILKEEPPEIAPGTMAPALDRIVRRCIEKDPDERFQSARDLAFALGTLSGIPSGAPSGVQPIEASLRARPRVRRGALVAAGLAAVLFVVGLALGPFVSPWRPVAPIASFQRLTFARGTIRSARFTPDGQTIVYSAAWNGLPLRTFLTRPESPASSLLQVPEGQVLSVSSKGDVAVSVGHAYDGPWTAVGTLSSGPLLGGAVREMLQGVRAADWSPAGDSLVVVRRIGNRDRLEYPAGKVLVETTGYISHARVSPDGRHIAFLDHPVYGDNRGTVAVVQPGGQMATLTPEWPSEEGLAWSPDGREIWFTASRGGGDYALHGVDLRGHVRVIFSAPVHVVLHDTRRDGQVLLTQEVFVPQISVASPGSSEQREVSHFDVSTAADLSRDGRYLLVSHMGAGSGANYAVYLQKTDGSSPVRLGDGLGCALSPDGSWALALVRSPKSQVVLLPTAAGESRALPDGGLKQLTADWFPDGRRILTCGDKDGATRCYVQDLESGAMRVAGDEGMRLRLQRPRVSPDGRSFVAVGEDGRVSLFDLEGGQRRVLPGIDPGEVAIQWTSDGRAVYVQRPGGVPAKVYRVDLGTGERTLWKEIAPPDIAGIISKMEILVTPDGRSYATAFYRMLSSLYLARGLR